MSGEFREARFYVQARYLRHICSELGIQFSTNMRKSPWAPQGTPRHPQGPPRDPQGNPKAPQGTPEGVPRDPMGPPRGPRAAQREPSGPQIQFKGSPKPVHGQPKQAKRTNYINKLPINRLRGRYVNNLREFLVNSRHPGPRREEGGLRAAVQMPLPGDPGDPLDPRENYGRLHSMRRREQIDTFARKWASNFHSFA